MGKVRRMTWILKPLLQIIHHLERLWLKTCQKFCVWSSSSIRLERAMPPTEEWFKQSNNTWLYRCSCGKESATQWQCEQHKATDKRKNDFKYMMEQERRKSARSHWEASLVEQSKKAGKGNAWQGQPLAAASSWQQHRKAEDHPSLTDMLKEILSKLDNLETRLANIEEGVRNVDSDSTSTTASGESFVLILRGKGDKFIQYQ